MSEQGMFRAITNFQMDTTSSIVFFQEIALIASCKARIGNIRLIHVELYFVSLFWLITFIWRFVTRKNVLESQIRLFQLQFQLVGKHKPFSKEIKCMPASQHFCTVDNKKQVHRKKIRSSKVSSTPYLMAYLGISSPPPIDGRKEVEIQDDTQHYPNLFLRPVSLHTC